MESRAIVDPRTPEEGKQSQAMMEDACLPLEQKKRKIQRNLRTLEQTGHVSSKNKYQDILNEIAKVSGDSILPLSHRHLLISGTVGHPWGGVRDSWVHTWLLFSVVLCDFKGFKELCEFIRNRYNSPRQCYLRHTRAPGVNTPGL